MVEHLNHFRFIERKESLFALFPYNSVTFKPIGLELLIGVEESGVATLMEHCKEVYIPRITAFFSGFIDKDRGSLIDIFGKICIAFGAKDGTGLSIGIEE